MGIGTLQRINITQTLSDRMEIKEKIVQKLKDLRKELKVSGNTTFNSEGNLVFIDSFLDEVRHHILKHILAIVNIQDTTGISKEWIALWDEIEDWYGDIQRKETGEQFLIRMQATYFVTPPATKQSAEEVAKEKNRERKSLYPPDVIEFAVKVAESYASGEIQSNGDLISVGGSWLDHHILNEDSEIEGVIITHPVAPETYGGVAVKTNIGSFAIVKEDQKRAAKNKGKTVRVTPHIYYYGTVFILQYLKRDV